MDILESKALNKEQRSWIPQFDASRIRQIAKLKIMNYDIRELMIVDVSQWSKCSYFRTTMSTLCL